MKKKLLSVSLSCAEATPTAVSETQVSPLSDVEEVWPDLEQDPDEG